MIGLDELTEWLELPPDTEDLELLYTLEKAAVAFLEEQTGRYFGPYAQRVQYINGNGRREVWLNELPVIQAGPPAYTLVVEEETSFNTWVVVPAADYYVREYRLVHASCWTRGRGNFRVTFTAGYAAGQEPEDIRQAVRDLVQLKYRGREDGGMLSESLDGYSFSKPATYAFEDGDLKQIPGLLRTIGQWKWRHV